jgi:hypothetical protein
VTRKPVTGESAKETVKTIARGMPDVSGVTVVTNSRVFYHHARLRAQRAPGIPCALLISEGTAWANPDVLRRGNVEV